MIYRKLAKRPLDLFVGLCALVIFGLPILLSVLAIKLTSPGPAFFFQTRAGRGGKPFRIYKLRTMTVDAKRPADVQVLKADSGVFPVGQFLRRFKIDELPQIINVVNGDMSLVGPRPCLEQTRDEMPTWARRRFEVRPGVTGLAQTSGNIALPWEERWKIDAKYIDQLSFALDFWIMLKTILVVLLGEEKFERKA